MAFADTMAAGDLYDPSDQKKVEDILETVGLHPAQMHVQGILAGGAPEVPVPAVPEGAMGEAAKSGTLLINPGTKSDTPAAPAAPQVRMPSPISPAGVPAMAAPVGAAAAPLIRSPQETNAIDQTETAQKELARKTATGSGISQIKNPFLRTLARVGDIAGTALFPGITAEIPGTELHHRLLMNEDAAQINQGLSEQEKIAQTEEQEARTELIKHPKPALEMTEQGLVRVPSEGEAAPVTMNGKPLTKATAAEKPEDVKHMLADAVQDAINRHVDPNEDPTVKQLIPFVQPDKPENAQLQAENAWLAKPENKGKDLSDAAKWYATLTPQARQEFHIAAPKGEPGSYTPVTNKAGDTIGWVDVKSGNFKPVGSIPGVNEALGGTGAIPAKPTMQMRNVGAQASLVHEQTPMMIAELGRLKDRMGPVAGRWNEFMQGKVGMDDPEFAGLRADLLMYSSAVALMHARGRLPENLREEFDHAINAPKQNADNLISVIQHIDQWTAKNMNVMQGGGGGTQAGGSGITVTDPRGAVHTFPDQKSADAFKKAAGIK